jgi:protein dithiol:quinone oxidoreductase
VVVVQSGVLKSGRFAFYFVRIVPWVLLLSAVIPLAIALFLQHFLQWYPCPLCVLQRLGFLALTVGAFLILCLPYAWGAYVAFLTGLATAAAAAVAWHHVAVLANPSIVCGIDPLETKINELWVVQQLPWLLKADGLCATPYPPILGFELPVWSAFILSTSVLLLFFLAVLLWCKIKACCIAEK